MTFLPSLMDYSHVDKTLGQAKIPEDLLWRIRSVDTFTSYDFQLDGVKAVMEDGSHAENPEPEQPTFEWRRFATPSVGLRWKKVPLLDPSEAYYHELDPDTVNMQKRLTMRAFKAYGGSEFLQEEEFLVSDSKKQSIQTTAAERTRVPREFSEKVEAVKEIQALVRRFFLLQLYPWYYMARLSLYAPVASTHKRMSRLERQSHMIASQSISSNISILPWCMCWKTLEPQFHLDKSSTRQMRRILQDFSAGHYEDCLRRVDNLILRQRSGAQDEKCLIELSALCNRFGMSLFTRDEFERAHAFFSRVLDMTNIKNNSIKFSAKSEIYAWTCDLVAYCLWCQEKHEQALWTVSRVSQQDIPFNVRVVNQLHVTQLALKVNKTDIAIKLGSRVLIDLMKSKFDHKVLARRSGSPRSREAKEILQIVDRKDEAQEPSSPSYDDLLAHQSQTLCFALVKAGRPQDAIIISNALRRKMEEGGDVSPDIVRCNQEFVSWAEEYEERKQAAERSHAAALSPGSRSRWSLRDQPCFEQTSSRSPSGTSERSYSQAILR
mmetsp:Transcript_10716/g.35891  ORF Transcript_10716/g.35891 Transcript_10716/m.35891 type:complete len:549 (+) Transcript_10716:310-1956(+)